MNFEEIFMYIGVCLTGIVMFDFIHDSIKRIFE